MPRIKEVHAGGRAKIRAAKLVVPPVKTRARPKPPPPIVLYPMRFEEIYKKKIWGGDGLRKVLGKKAPPRTGESWEVAQMGRDVSVVANGKLKGRSLADLYATYRLQIAGSDRGVRSPEAFPLLVKFLCCQDRLSLQVHPSDEFAARFEAAGRGKMEAWVVVHAPPDSRVIRGVLPGITIAEFRQALAEGRVEECLNVMEVSPGDVIFIPPGTVHSAFGGLIVLEVQEGADVTYRLSDWGRPDFDGKLRELSVQKAIAAMDFYTMGVTKFQPQRLRGYAYKRKLLLKCEKFTLELMELSGHKVKEVLTGTHGQVLSVLRGHGAFCYGPKYKAREAFAPGQSFLLPAGLGSYEIAPRGAAEIVVTY